MGIYKVINPFVRLLIKLGLTPNAVTTIGLALNIGVAVIFILGAEKGNRGDLHFVGWAGALVLFAGVFDMLDGQVARLGNMKSTFGAMYDSVLDRYSELILFLGICYYLISHHYFLSSLFAFIAMIGSMMVSYTRARAEGLGVECKGGVMQRPERVVLIGVSAIVCGISSNFIGGDYKLYIPGFPLQVFETISIFTVPITVMAIMTNLTAFRRLADSKKALDLMDAQAKVAGKDNSRAALGIVFVLFASFAFPSVVLSSVRSTTNERPEVVETSTPGFPVPKVSNQLFYLQRDPNANTIVCQLNLDSEGMPNQKTPINVFWIRYAEGGKRTELNFVQRKFAYGMTSKQISADKHELKFVSYGKYPMYLMRGKDKKYHVFSKVANRQAILNSIYVHIDGGTFWVPNIVYVEFKATDPDTGEQLTERIKV
jgi:phosphatidylglycerophosphate synthase